MYIFIIGEIWKIIIVTHSYLGYCILYEATEFSMKCGGCRLSLLGGTSQNKATPETADSLQK